MAPAAGPPPGQTEAATGSHGEPAAAAHWQAAESPSQTGGRSAVIMIPTCQFTESRNRVAARARAPAVHVPTGMVRRIHWQAKLVTRITGMAPGSVKLNGQLKLLLLP